VKELIKKFTEQLPANFSMIEINMRAKEKSPYVVVCLQECERMNTLLSTIRFSLFELDAGLKGQLNITDSMEVLSTSLALNRVPAEWEKYAYFSKKSLLDWFIDLLLRITQLTNWSTDLITPKSLWIPGLFNPMSFLTAIMQVTARQNNLPLDDMTLRTDVTNTRSYEDLPGPAESGSYVHGFFLEGAGWEMGRGGEQGYLADMILKELHPEVPVIHVTSIRMQERRTAKGNYECPVYVTSMRGPTIVFTAYLKMESEESDPNKWILAGAALLMSPE
jgi:dynein heavy chain